MKGQWLCGGPGLLGQGGSKSSSAHLVTFRCTWMQSLAEIHRKYVWQGQEKKLSFPAKQEGKSHRSAERTSLLSREQAGASFTRVHNPGHLLDVVCSFSVPPALSHCRSSAHGQALFLSKLILLISSHFCIMPEQVVLSAGLQAAGQSLCPDCSSSLFFVGKETWLAGYCLEFVTNHPGLSQNVTGWEQVEINALR